MSEASRMSWGVLDEGNGVVRGTACARLLEGGRQGGRGCQWGWEEGWGDRCQRMHGPDEPGPGAGSPGPSSGRWASGLVGLKPSECLPWGRGGEQMCVLKRSLWRRTVSGLGGMGGCEKALRWPLSRPAGREVRRSWRI